MRKNYAHRTKGGKKRERERAKENEGGRDGKREKKVAEINKRASAGRKKEVEKKL